jgi:hypothetical protein
MISRRSHTLYRITANKGVPITGAPVDSRISYVRGCYTCGGSGRVRGISPLENDSRWDDIAKVWQIVGYRQAEGWIECPDCQQGRYVGEARSFSPYDRLIAERLHSMSGGN